MNDAPSELNQNYKKKRVKRRRALDEPFDPPQLREPTVSDEVEKILTGLQSIAADIGANGEPSTALLLYTLFQYPGTVAHQFLGTLPLDVDVWFTIYAIINRALSWGPDRL